MSRVKNLQFLTIQLTDHWMAHDLNSDKFLTLVIIQFSRDPKIKLDFERYTYIFPPTSNTWRYKKAIFYNL